MKKAVVLWFAFAVAAALGGPAQPLNAMVFSNQPPVMAGPDMDPESMAGQWFEDIFTGETDARPWEFHDHTAPTSSIVGRVIFVDWVTPGPSPSTWTDIRGFDVEVTIFNDLPSQVPQLGSSNAHGEVQTNAVDYGGIMFDTRISAEFAISDVMRLPPLGLPYYPDPSFGQPYGTYYIQAENETHRAWYCWTHDDPGNNRPKGNFNIPTWDVGDIAPGESRTILMHFTIVDSLGNPTNMVYRDERMGAIRASYFNGWDIYYNRYPSLKCSDWLETICVDNGSATWMNLYQWNEEMEEWEIEPVIKWSDVSVFFNSTPGGESAPLAIDIRADTNSANQVVADLTADIRLSVPHDLLYTDALTSNTLWNYFGTYWPTGTLPQQITWTDPITTNSTNRFYKVMTP